VMNNNKQMITARIPIRRRTPAQSIDARQMKLTAF
jgi:hypothetical protein